MCSGLECVKSKSCLEEERRREHELEARSWFAYSSTSSRSNNNNNILRICYDTASIHMISHFSDAIRRSQPVYLRQHPSFFLSFFFFPLPLSSVFPTHHGSSVIGFSPTQTSCKFQQFTLSVSLLFEEAEEELVSCRFQSCSRLFMVASSH